MTHPDGATQNASTIDEAAEKTAEQFILSHLAQHNIEANTSSADIGSFADFLPEASLNADIDATLAERDQAIDETSAQMDTPSVLSRLKKGLPGSCDICGRTETTVWRKLTLGGEDHKVCNGALHQKRAGYLV